MSEVVEMTIDQDEARALTDRIRDSIEKTYELVLTAYERKAWKVMGYDTWEAYVQTEFDMSRRRSYQLLDQGRVIRAIEQAVGEDVYHGTQISERTSRELSADIPGSTEAIRQRVEQGEDPAQAAKDIAAQRRAEKGQEREEHRAKQAEFDRQRDEAQAALPESIKQQQAVREEAIAERERSRAELEAELEELREANAALEVEAAELRAENAKWQDMKAQFELGGFEKVIAGKDEEIRALLTRVEAESRDKAGWAKSAAFWKSEALKLGYSSDEMIPLGGAHG